MTNISNKKDILIFGINGQDGYYLADLFLNEGYRVHGVIRSPSKVPAQLKKRLRSLSVIDLRKPKNLQNVLLHIKPLEIYYLAAAHCSSESNNNFSISLNEFVSLNVLVPNIILDTMKTEKMRKTRFFYASSCHIFGFPEKAPQTEKTPQRPNTPYGITKAAGLNLCSYYRKFYGLYASVGILYNHESPRRSLDFVTAKIARCAALAYLGKPEKIIIRNLNAVVDWGAAEDYVKAMRAIMKQPSGDAYIISSGKQRTVWDFAKIAFGYVNMNGKDFIIQKNKNKKNIHLPYVGDNSKIKRTCHWKPTTPFHDMVKGMVDAHIGYLTQKLKYA